MMKSGAVSDPRSKLRWDIFLSFQRDMRHNFTERLYEVLVKEQVRVWKDDVERGNHELGPSLVEAMEDSMAYIVVLSPNYAKSHLCLEELAKLCDLKSSLGRLVLPIFYEVDPWIFRKQNGPFEMEFEEHSKRFSEEKVQRWKRAMNLIGNISGFVYGYESTKTSSLILFVTQSLHSYNDIIF
ncbi:Disease resistance protein RPV1 [Cardamine amara subsp. amara]|uniref:Disease resistance protein RPV1 n=1 Tax=Cardamine amara subsp. amara TaxID=228776 RepID=A0ABD1BP88_CARAN